MCWCLHTAAGTLGKLWLVGGGRGSARLGLGLVIVCHAASLGVRESDLNLRLSRA